MFDRVPQIPANSVSFKKDVLKEKPNFCVSDLLTILAANNASKLGTMTNTYCRYFPKLQGNKLMLSFILNLNLNLIVTKII